MKTHDEMIQAWMQDPAFAQEYDALEDEFTLFDELLRARKEAGLTQAEVEVTPTMRQTVLPCDDQIPQR